MISEQDVIDAVAEHGAKVICDAAYAHMAGTRPGLQGYGLNPSTMGDVWQVALVSQEMMSATEKAAFVADTAIKTAQIDARLPGGV